MKSEAAIYEAFLKAHIARAKAEEDTYNDDVRAWVTVLEWVLDREDSEQEYWNFMEDLNRRINL
jgi:hypothetical protein